MGDLVREVLSTLKTCLRFNAAVAVSVTLLVAACEDKNTYVPPPPPQVTVATPVKKTVVENVDFTGNTAAIQSVALRARVEGYLEKVLFEDGARVKKGDLLFLIEQAQYINAVEEAKGQLGRAQAAAKQANLTADRRRQAGRSGAISQQQVDEAEAIAQGQAAEVLSRQAELDQARLNLSYTEVRAPFDGRMDRRLEDPGNLVGFGENTVLSTMNQIDPIYAYFTINERELLRILGQRDRPDPGTEGEEKKQLLFLGLADEEGYPHEGIFDFAAISLDSATGTLLLRGIFPNPDNKILAGLFVRIRAPIADKENALLVPQQAVSFDQQGEYVFVVKDDDTIERRGVTLGPLSGDMRVIEKGLNGNERVVVEGLLRAIPGRKVTPVTAQASTPSETKAQAASAESKPDEARPAAPSPPTSAK